MCSHPVEVAGDKLAYVGDDVGASLAPVCDVVVECGVVFPAEHHVSLSRVCMCASRDDATWRRAARQATGEPDSVGDGDSAPRAVDRDREPRHASHWPSMAPLRHFPGLGVTTLPGRVFRRLESFLGPKLLFPTY